MIYWEEQSLLDRERIFEFLHDYNPVVAERTDEIIEAKTEALADQPLMGVERDNMRGRLLIIPDVSMIVSYLVDGQDIRVMRVFHQKQNYPSDQ